MGLAAYRFGRAGGDAAGARLMVVVMVFFKRRSRSRSGGEECAGASRGRRDWAVAVPVVFVSLAAYRLCWRGSEGLGKSQ